jgi:signal transduction histidine kinase
MVPDLQKLSADQLIQYVSWGFYLLIFALSIVRAIRSPLRSNINIAALFSITALTILLSVLTSLQVLPEGGLTSSISTSLILAMPYTLLRLADDFTEIPAWQMRGAEAILVLLVAGVFLMPPPLPLWFVLSLIVYLLAFFTYTTVVFMRTSARTSGVTRRRLRAVSVGSIALIVGFAILGIGLFVPGSSGFTRVLYDIVGLVSGIGYYLGFATPRTMRRAWQEPELRAFLSRAANLPRLPDTRTILQEMERGVASSVGTPGATIGLWNEEKRVLRYDVYGTISEAPPMMSLASGRAFLTQKAVFTPQVQLTNAAYVSMAKRLGAQAILAAPISAGDKRLGVLVVYAPRAPVFAEEDLALVQLLADQAAVVLESRALIDEAARVRAREEVTRLKEDFLSAAAHDLKTPLTTLVAQTQLLERRVQRAPDKPIDLDSVRRLVKEALRLKNLVLELLDVARAEQGKLVSELEFVDITQVAEEVCARHSTERHPCSVEAQGEVLGTYDSLRIFQLLENLVENAVKYSPEGGAVHVRAWQEDGWNHLAVEDEGIGIPADDLPSIFNRFHRGTNVDDRRFAGMGLGLFICRGIAEQHGGRISATSTPGKGTTFRVDLPVNLVLESAGAEVEAPGLMQESRTA